MAQSRLSAPAPVKLTAEGRRWAEKTLKSMALQEKVGQMLSLRYYLDFENFTSGDYRQIREQIRKYHIGSLVLTVHTDGSTLLKSPPLEAAAMTNQLQRDSRIPLLFAADFERGLSSRIIGVPVFPDAMAFGALDSPAAAEKFGEITARSSRAIGIQWDLFPVADVNINPANPIINTRSFGEDPQQVATLVTAFIRGAHKFGMLTAVKHFPGHGDTATDSHLGVARVDADLARLQSVELVPFKAGIAAGVDSVLTAHVAVPALDPDPGHVATISPAIVTGLLRGQLGFKGVAITDALEMRGLTSLYPPGQGSPTARAAVDAVKAGNDIILWPTDVDGAFHAIVEAVKRREIPLSRINASVRRILLMKASVRLYKSRYVDLQKVSWAVGRPEDMAFAQQVADNAITLVRDNGRVLPLPAYPLSPIGQDVLPAQVQPASHLVLVILTDSVRSGAGRGLEQALKARRADATVFYVDPGLTAALGPGIMQAVARAGRVVVAAYAVPTAAKQVMVNGQLTNSVGLQPSTGDLLNDILNAAAGRTVLVAMGNPYLAQNFPAVQNYICSYSNVSSSELGVVKALFGEIRPAGKLPVTIPGIAPRGSSLPWPGFSAPGTSVH